MLPIVLVLLAATSALALPTVNVEVRSLNDVAPLPNNGELINANLLDQALEILDGGVTNIYTALAQKTMYRIANQRDRYSQALAAAQTLALLRQYANGIPGDSCAAASLINPYTLALQTGNFNNVRLALLNYIQTVLTSIDVIAQLAINSDSLKNTSGARGNCLGGGRSYQFDVAWDAIRNSSNQNGLVDEQRCYIKQLFETSDVRSNNVAAAFTAASLPIVNRVFQISLPYVAAFLESLPSGNVGASAALAKQALREAASRI